ALGVIEGDGPEPRGRFGPMVRIEVGARARIRHFHPAGLGFLVAGRRPRAAEISVERRDHRLLAVAEITRLDAVLGAEAAVLRGLVVRPEIDVLVTDRR